MRIGFVRLGVMGLWGGHAVRESLLYYLIRGIATTGLK